MRVPDFGFFFCFVFCLVDKLDEAGLLFTSSLQEREKKWMSGGKKMQLEYATELRRRIWSSKLSKLHGTHSTR